MLSVLTEAQTGHHTTTPIPVILDTDANNEIDDQHAMAYLFSNSDVFHAVGITVNATPSGGAIELHVAEAERVMRLYNLMQKVPLLSGANGNFEVIRPSLNTSDFDGRDAVEFIIAEARKERATQLVLVPIGKLTNIALALAKAPDIVDKVRIVWLGSNYPDPGEYNLVSDIPALNYIIETDVPFEMVMVRYGEESGSDAVRATPKDIQERLQRAGPEVEPVEGRHGSSFSHFGDYALNLFEQIELHGDPPSRALFDVVALAILKNSSWGQTRVIPKPTMVEKKWIDRPNHPAKLLIWENFDRQSILEDFYSSLSSMH